MSTPTRSSWSPRTRLADLSVGLKLTTAVAVVALVACAVGALSINRLGQLADRSATISDSNVPSVLTLGRLRADVMLTRTDLLVHAVSPDQAGKAKAEDALKADDQQVADDITAYRTSSPAALPQVLRFADVWSQYQQLRDGTLLPASRVNDLATFAALRTKEAAPLITDALGELDQASTAEEADAATSKAAASDTASGARTAILVMLVLGLALGTGWRTGWPG